MAPASSASSSKEEETNKFSLSAESISEQEDGRKTEKEATAKKLKRNVSGDTEDTKRKKKQQQHCNPDESALFTRLWSKEDEVALLKGIKIFENVGIPQGEIPQGEKRRKVAPLFFEYIKDDIHFDVSRKQLNSKISKLKRKFEENMKANRCTFDNSHKQKVYDLSKLIWDVEAKGSNEVIAKELKVCDSDEGITKKLEVLESYFGTDGKETEMKKYFILGLNSLEGSKKKEMIKEYWQWFLCMMDLVGKQNDIIRKHHDLLKPVYKTY
ncbi:hypothetical protein H0E87_025259 [Populus deltoides]|jgi:hypothetical protein|uniref:Glabrous enhancer-binding protein-like DBD domain-containing protein n=1 Tax=Populus deltoides TaxID=3696 RepID=A0A8T2XC48_POPDE|nr:hypothetical protein H0E87_025259 [Populus deltoides]